MAFNIDIGSYLPDQDNLPADKVNASVELSKALARIAFPDLDVRINTPFFDLFIAPAARERAAQEIALGRLLSDMDLANIREGIVYNCDFVEQYLSSLGVGPDRIVPATGVLLIQFAGAGPHSLPAHTIFGEGNTRLQASNRFTDGIINFAAPPASADIPLFQVSEGIWAGEVPVSGVVDTDPADPEPIAAGETLGYDQEEEAVVSITTATEIDPGYPPLSLEDRAKLVPPVFPGLNTNTPAGLVSWVRTIYPNTKGVSPVVDGDIEMIRENPDNVFGLVDGKTDLYVRGSSLVSRTLTVPVTRNGSTWSKVLDAGSPILKVSSFRLHGTSEDLAFTVESETTDAGVLPADKVGYTEYEKLTLSSEAVIDAADQVIPPSGSPDLPYAFFDITVLVDPHVTQVKDRLSRRDYSPVTGDILVRPFVPAFLDEIRIFYRRKSGKEIDKTEAVDELVDYILSATYPNVFETVTIGEILLYWGAAGVSDVECDWTIRKSAADTYNDGVSSTSVPVYNPANLSSALTSLSVGLGPRNIGPVVDRANIKLLPVV